MTKSSTRCAPPVLRALLGTGTDKVPDAKTVWLYREQLSQAGLIESLFEDFDAYLDGRSDH